MPDIPLPSSIRRRRRNLRLAAVLGGVAAVAAAGALIFVFLPRGASVSRSALLIAPVKSGRLALRVQAPGTLEPKVRRWVTAAVPGVVEAVNVQPGDRVKAGTVLAVLGNPKLHADLISARADLATAQATLVSLKAQLQNQLLDLKTTLASTQADAAESAFKVKAQAHLVANHVVSRLDYERSRLDAQKYSQQVSLTKQRISSFRDSMAAQIKAQQAKVGALKAALDEKQSEVRSLKIRAGMPGVVQAVAVQTGQTLSLGGNIARVASLRHLKAVLQVSPSEANGVAANQPVSVSFDVGSDPSIDGKVTRIAPAVSNGSVDVDVGLPASLPDGARPNLSVSGTIAVATLPHTLYIQRPVYSKPGSTQTLYKIVDGGKAAVPVQVRFGRASAQQIQVLAGLRPGDRIIVSDTSEFAGAKRVRIQ